MPLIDFSGVTRVTTKLGSAVVATVQPVANIIEIATESSQAWTENHAADVAAKTQRQQKVRAITHETLLREAQAKAQRAALSTNDFVRKVQEELADDQLKERVHKARMAALVSVDDSIIADLAKRDNLTTADIRRAARIGFNAKPQDSEEVKSEFNINDFGKSND